MDYNNELDRWSANSHNRPASDKDLLAGHLAEQEREGTYSSIIIKTAPRALAGT
jgi:hypothetical protein